MISRIEELFNFAFTKGCGLTLSQVRRSKSYRRNLEKTRQLVKRHSPRTATGLVLRSDPIKAGSFLNCLPETAALELLWQEPVIKLSEDDFEHRVLIKTFGELLTATAKLNLPPPLKRLARNIRQVKKPVDWIRFGHQFGHLSEGLHRSLMTKMSDEQACISITRDNDLSRFLPLEWLKKFQVNCFGRALTALAVARLARLRPAILALPLRNIFVEMNYFGEDLARLLTSDLKRRKLHLPHGLNIDPDSQEKSSWDAYWPLAHHSFVIAQSKIGWLTFDASLPTLADYHFSMEDASQTLHRYREVFPGLNIILATHPDNLEKLFCLTKSLYDIVFQGIYKSYLVTQALKPKEETALDQLRRLRSAFKNDEKNLVDFLKSLIACLFPVIKKSKPLITTRQLITRLISDHRFRNRHFHNLPSLVHYSAIRSVKNVIESLLNSGALFYPCCCFGQSEYNIAFNALFNIACHLGITGPELSLFLRHGFDPFILASIINLPYWTNHQETDKIRSALYSLPYGNERILRALEFHQLAS